MPLNKHKIILNDKVNLQTGLNELYHELDFLINQIQGEYTKLADNTSLVDMNMEDKSEYAKSIHNFLVSKANVMKLKIEVQKIVAEVLKTGGNEMGAFNNLKAGKGITGIDVKSLQKVIQENQQTSDDTNNEVVYKV